MNLKGYILKTKNEVIKKFPGFSFVYNLDKKEGTINFLDKEYLLKNLGVYYLENKSDKKKMVVKKMEMKNAYNYEAIVSLYLPGKELFEIGHLIHILEKQPYSINFIDVNILNSYISYEGEVRFEDLLKDVFLKIPYEGEWKIFKGFYNQNMDRKTFIDLCKEITKEKNNPKKIISYFQKENINFYEVFFEDKFLRLFL